MLFLLLIGFLCEYTLVKIINQFGKWCVCIKCHLNQWYGVVEVQLLPLLVSFTSLPSAVGGSKSDRCGVIGCSRRRLPWHSGCCTESAPQHQQATDLHPPCYPPLLLFFLLLCLSSSHQHPSSLLSVPPPRLPPPRQAGKAAATASAAGWLVGVLRPGSLLQYRQGVVFSFDLCQGLSIWEVCVCMFVRERASGE